MSNELCPFCKSEIPNGASVCSGCGAHRERKSDTTRIKILGFVFPLFVVVCIYYLRQSTRKYTSNWLRSH